MIISSVNKYTFVPIVSMRRILSPTSIFSILCIIGFEFCNFNMYIASARNDETTKQFP